MAVAGANGVDEDGGVAVALITEKGRLASEERAGRARGPEGARGGSAALCEGAGAREGRWVVARSGVANYSLRNQLVVCTQIAF